MPTESLVTWRIDEKLGLHQVGNDCLINCSPLQTPEQSIDTILHRNGNIFTNFLFQQSSKFIYHSADYWGEFDVCLQLENGAYVAIEDKGKKLTKKDFQKFVRDTRVLKERGSEYIQMRFEHVQKYYPRYLVLAERMFAAFFLGVRCDIEKNQRNLADEACKQLSITQDSFQSRLTDLNQWLLCLADKPSFVSYVYQPRSGPADYQFHPVLLVPAASLPSVQTWIAEITEPLGIEAMLLIYNFFSQTTYPQYLSIISKSLIQI